MVVFSNPTKRYKRSISNVFYMSNVKKSENEKREKYVELRIKIENDMMQALEEIKEFYNLRTRTELFRLMIIRFYNFIKEEKAKGHDKFSI